MNHVKITLTGQVRGGKNHVGITRTGIRYPMKNFRLWRDDAVRQIKEQTRGLKRPCITRLCTAYILYTPVDRRKRDLPAVMDGIWHVLERAGIVADDALITGCRWDTGEPSKAGAGVVIVLEVI